MIHIRPFLLSIRDIVLRTTQTSLDTVIIGHTLSDTYFCLFADVEVLPKSPLLYPVP
jgi:hypothetical protein